MRVAYGNPDRAFEILMSGAIPSEGGSGEDMGEEEYGEEEGSASIGGGAAGANPFA